MPSLRAIVVPPIPCSYMETISCARPDFLRALRNILIFHDVSGFVLLFRFSRH